MEAVTLSGAVGPDRITDELTQRHVEWWNHHELEAVANCAGTQWLPGRHVPQREPSRWMEVTDHATSSYSWMSPPTTSRRRMEPVRLVVVVVGRGGESLRPR